MSVAWVLKREVTTVPSTPRVITLLVRLTATVTQALTWPSAAGGSGGVKVRERQVPNYATDNVHKIGTSNSEILYWIN